MVEADRVAVVCAGPALRLAQPDRRLLAADVPDRLAALSLHFAQAMPAERAEQLAIEREAALDRGDDEVDVMDAHEPTELLRASPDSSYDSARASVPLPPRDEQGARSRG